MLNAQVCRLFLVLPLLAGLYSVNGNVSKRGCIGDSIKLAENISYNSSDIVVTIYKNGDSKLILGMWHVTDGIPVIKNGQSDRMVLDRKGNIWILNLIISDEAEYKIKTDIGNSSQIYDVPLEVMAPPTKNCKPSIISAGNNLFAELKTDECGRPAASAYWLEHSGISFSKQVLQLQPGNDNGIYHACIEGDALICAKISNFSEHCSFYNKSEPKLLINQSMVDSSTPCILTATYNIPRASAESSTATIYICVMVTLCLILQIVKWVETLYQRWKIVRETPTPENIKKNGFNDTPLEIIPEVAIRNGVPETTNHETLPGNASPTNPPRRGKETHENGPEKTDLNTVSVEVETQPLISHSCDDTSSPRRSPDTSAFEKAGSDTAGKELVQDPSLLEEKGETLGTVPKLSGTKPKSITPLPPGKKKT